MPALQEGTASGNSRGGINHNPISAVSQILLKSTILGRQTQQLFQDDLSFCKSRDLMSREGQRAGRFITPCQSMFAIPSASSAQP
jgi:hypothetical protein